MHPKALFLAGTVDLVIIGAAACSDPETAPPRSAAATSTAAPAPAAQEPAAASSGWLSTSSAIGGSPWRQILTPVA